MIGKVKWFNNEKGYGFISCDDKDILVHYSSILTKGYKSLTKDEIVKLDIVETSNGLRAKNVISIKEL